jgi:DNA-3-methyladenine glycosylase I
MSRCPWPGDDELMISYHDLEWGVPLHDDRALFEFLVLDGFQAGLSWRIVLRKRDAFRRVFGGFDPELVARFSEDHVERLLQDAGIIRNRAKVRSAVTNAQAFLKVRDEFGSFDLFIWKFTDGAPLVNNWEALSQVPARSEESDKMSRELLQRGFKFAGSVICYAFMQAAGMVNDHLVACPRWAEVQKRNLVFPMENLK